MNEKSKKCFDAVANFFKAKRFGFYVGLAGAVIALVGIIAYGGMESELFNYAVIWLGVCGIVCFVALSLWSKTSSLAPVALMVFEFLAFASWVGADGIIDYFSTYFFDGFSTEKLFALPSSLLVSIICLIAAFVVASVAMYMPQNKNQSKNTQKTMEQCDEKD